MDDCLWLAQGQRCRLAGGVGNRARSRTIKFKCGQGAKTGTGGHLPGIKVKGRIAAVRGLNEGEAAISPSRFPDWDNIDESRRFGLTRIFLPKLLRTSSKILFNKSE